MRTTIEHEIKRAAGVFELTSSDREHVGMLVEAFKIGQVVPGYFRAGPGQPCSMDWSQLACFARWYSRLDGVGRDEVLFELTQGNPWPWTQPTEYPYPPPPDPCPETPTPQQVGWCCPPQVYGDPQYTQEFPWIPKEDKSNLVPFLVGAGAVTAILVGVAILASGSKR